MSGRRDTLLLSALGAAVLLLLAALVWANVRFVRASPDANDFLPRWQGTRLFLLTGASPYSEETTRANQVLAYGRQARPGEDPQRFVYPFYAVLAYAPFALIEDYFTARVAWMTAMQLVVVLLVVASINLSRWRIRPAMFMAVMLFTGLWYYSVRPIISQDISPLIGLLIAGAFLAIRSETDVLGGLLLGLATVKPQVVLLLVPFVLIWAISQSRWLVVWSFFVTVAFLSAAMMLFFPSWMLDNLRQVIDYLNYAPPGTPRAIFMQTIPGVGSQLAWLFTILVATLLLVEWRAALRKAFPWFFWTACLTLVLTSLAGVYASPDNYIVLLPALILVLGTWDERWGRLGRWLVIASLLLLFFGLWLIFYFNLPASLGPVTPPVFFFFLPFFLLIGLYWVRWWAINPPRLLIDELIEQVG